MKDERKCRGTKARVQAEREREKRLATAIFLGCTLLAAAFFSHIAYTTLVQQQKASPVEPAGVSEPANATPTLSAAIVDQLGLTAPSEDFVATVSTLLTEAGYVVDYYATEQVTVDFYRALPTYGYELVILRVHSSATEFSVGMECPVTIFTSEPHRTTNYVYDQLTDRLFGVAFSREEGDAGAWYFGIGPLFVTHSMKGRFSNTTIVMMGCEGLGNTLMAQAFVDKGAQAYISWNASVSVFHTDKTTAALLEHLLVGRQTICQAVENAMEELGPDPTFHSILQYYPLTAGELTADSTDG